MALANQEAQRFNHEYIGTGHVLLGLAKEGSGVGANVLKRLDIDLRKLRMTVEKEMAVGPDIVTMGKLPQTPQVKKVIDFAIEESQQLGHNYVGTEHLLLALLRDQGGGDTIARQVLLAFRLNLEDTQAIVVDLLGSDLAQGCTTAPQSPVQSAVERLRKLMVAPLDCDLIDLSKMKLPRTPCLANTGSCGPGEPGSFVGQVSCPTPCGREGPGPYQFFCP